MCAGCQHSRPQLNDATSPALVNLPPRPDYVRPVPVPQYVEGDDAFAKLGETKQALTKANKRLVKAGRLYDKLRADSAGKAAQ